MSPSIRAHAAAISQQHATSARSFFERLDDLSSFTPEPSDIFIISFMKSGTTLLQQLLYQLFAATNRVPSDPTGENFSDISEVVPFVDARFATGVATSPNPYTPRLWKSHAPVANFAHMRRPGGRTPRFIYCFREGRQVIRSYADFAVDWLATEPIETDELRAEIYRKIFLNCFLGLDDAPDGGLQCVDQLYDWFGHVRGWLDSQHTVLFVHFNDLVADLQGWVKRLAKFVGVEVDARQVEWVVAKCDRARMAEDERFKDGLVAKLMGWRMDLGLRVRREGDRGFREVGLPPECDVEYLKRFRSVLGEGGWEQVVSAAEARNEQAGV